MKKIGVLFGVENAFPGALVERINALDADDVRAEFVHVGGVEMSAPCPYAVLIDRISHDMPFYRAYLKHAMLTGTYVINNPFWWSADDKFFNYSLAERLGVNVPPTVLLPPKKLPNDLNERSVRNLAYPLPWEELFAHVGFPAYLKRHDGGGWRDVHFVQNADEFFAAYDQTGDLAMMLQRAVEFEQYFRCFVIGQQEVRVMPWDPRQPAEFRYLRHPPECEAQLVQRIEQESRLLCQALGYDVNTVEFAVKDGVPYAIDFMNPAPDADPFSVGNQNFLWLVDAVARFAIAKACRQPGQGPELRWASVLSGVTRPQPGNFAQAAKKRLGLARKMTGL